MTITEYAYTERDIYTAIVQTAVPIALTADETSLLVADLIALAAEMPHDTPACVYAEWSIQNDIGYDRIDAMSDWRNALTRIRRSAVLARQAAEYPSLKREV